MGDANNASVHRHAVCLTSGTIATLTGKRRYDEIDRIQGEFAEFIRRSPVPFDTWQAAWDLFAREMA